MKLNPLRAYIYDYIVYRVINRNNSELVCKVDVEKWIDDKPKYEKKLYEQYAHEIKHGVRLDILLRRKEKKKEIRARDNNIFEYYLTHVCFECGIEDVARHFNMNPSEISRIISKYLENKSN